VEKRGTAYVQLIGYAAERPDIDFLVIGSPGQNLRGSIVEGANVFLGFMNDCTAEITQLINILYNRRVTWEIKMLSGLMSWWIISIS
jgi:hypothetical protein